MQRDLLRLADPSWVERLARGMRLLVIGVLASTVIQIGAGIAVIPLTSRAPAAITPFLAGAGLISAGLSVVVVIGVWLFTTPDPGRGDRERGVSVRALTRWCLMAQIAAAPLQLADPTGGMGVGGVGAAVGGWRIALTVAGIALWLVVLVGYVAGFVYLRRLALRIPRPSLARQTPIVMWGYLVSQMLAVVLGVIFLAVIAPTFGPGGTPQSSALLIVFSVGGCAVTLGTLVFGIWALVLLFMYRSAFKRAAQEARAAWDAWAHAPATS
jgi:hypothetical protein